jgi:hypothetical protein
MWPRAWRKNRLEGNRGTRGVYLFATGLITKGGLKLIGNVSQNILLTVGALYILFVSKEDKMRQKRLTPPFIDLLDSFIKCMLIWTEG